MLSAIVAWASAQLEARERAQFENGFDFAAGSLLAGETVDDVARQVQDDKDPFDGGMELAIRTWCRQMNKPLPINISP